MPEGECRKKRPDTDRKGGEQGNKELEEPMKTGSYE